MKQIIDIDDKLYKDIQTIGIPIGKIDYVLKAIKNGTPIPDNTTNGNVIKAMFPNLKITEMNDSVSVMGEHYEFNNFYPFDFWNAPYKTESEDNNE